MPDHVEPAGFDRLLHLLQVREKNIIQRAFREVVGKYHHAVRGIVHRPDNEVELAPILVYEPLHMLDGAFIEVHLRPA